ncbi:MAG: hypothetical protein PHY14_03225 [Candidatus Gracilibacteria bacterium]|nr:hypothetical protein [Candidatus Gracilibacteria bacterium]
MNQLEQACHDVIYKSMSYTDETLYFLYDTESPLAKLLSDAYLSVLPKGGKSREFINPPQPLYRGGLINPDNPHIHQQNRVITLHNMAENERVGLDHHKVLEVKSEVEPLDPQVESIKDELMNLPKGSIVILVQSSNFRLSTFRIRLELFHRGIHVIEHNHLAYIKESEFDTFIDCIQYRTPEYVRLLEVFTDLFAKAKETRLISTDGSKLVFGPVDRVLGNTGDYSKMEHKGGTLPVGEVLTEALDLKNVNGKCLIDTYPGDDFNIRICDPFEMVVENGRVLPSLDFPPEFQKLYNMIRDNENGEVLVRELGLGLNPAPTTETPLSDINFHERKIGIHLSIGKKHGLYGKKLPKTEVQRFHIDIFIALESMYVGDVKVFENGNWIV